MTESADPSLPLYVDLDDVVCETARTLARLALREFGTRIAFEDIHDFNLMRSFRLDAVQYERLMDLSHAAEVLGQIEPVAGAVEGLRAWIGRGRAVTFVTGRPPATAPATRDWLRRAGLHACGLVFVDKYGRHAGAVAAGESLTLDELAQRRFLLAVEDEPKTAAFIQERLRVPVLLLDRPWNRKAVFSVAGGASVTRCQDWQEIARHLA